MSDAALLALAAGHPVPLEALPGIWRLDSGSLDLFAMRRSAVAARGRREFLLRLDAGSGLCGLDGVAGSEVVLVVVGGPGTRLVQASSPRTAADAWVAATATTLHDPARGWTDHLGQPGEATLPAGTHLGCAGRQILWATVLAGSISARTGEAAEPGDAPVAVTAATPVLTLAPAQVLLRSSDALGHAEWGAALTAHGARLLRHAAAVLHARDIGRAAQVATSQAASRAGVSDGLLGLAGLGTTGGLDTGDGDPVWRALSQVANAIGHPAPAQPTGISAQGSGPERLNAYAEAISLRLRRVMLRDRWWRSDNGPLIAWRQGSGDPVALLHGWNGYRIFDTVLQRFRRLTAGAAEALEPEAWMPYRGFPAGPLGLRDLLRHILPGLRTQRGSLLWLSLAAAALGLSVPLAFGILGDAIIPRSDLPALATLGGALLAAAFGAASVEVSRGLLLQRMEARAMHDTQAALLDRLLRLPADFFRRFGSADLADRILIIDLVRRSLTGARLNGAIAGLLALGNVVVMLACNLPLGLLGTMLALVAGGFGLRLCVPQARIERRQAEDRGRTVNLTLEAISGVAKLKVAAATDRVLALWLRAYGRQHRSFIAARRITTWQAVFLTAFLPLAMIALFLLAAPVDLAAGLRDAQVMGGPAGDNAGPPASSRFSLGAWLAFNCAFGQLMAGIGQMLPAVSGSVAAVPVYARAKPVLEAPLESRAGYKPPSVLSGAIEFSHVSFTYAATDALVLPELSFNIRPGEFVAIVGPSGGGKSTILRLLLGFETPGSGAVLYDGRPLATLDVAAVRRQVGAVLQNGRLQAGSILDNIGGDRPIELGEAWSAVELAGLAPDIRALPMGMYTMLSEAGGTLSGGQRQRLLIARALARRPRVLLLDEATSALDNRTQSVVGEAVASLGLTRLVVAHRLSTIAAADRILVLCQGRLVQMGRYGELMAEPGLFRDMAERQLA